MGQNSSLARSVEARNAPELSPVRHRLRQAITIVATAQRELGTATAPLQRPDTVAAATNQLKREASAASSSRRSREQPLNRGTQRRRPAATVESGLVLMIGRLIGVPASRRLWRRRRSFEASGGCGRAIMMAFRSDRLLGARSPHPPAACRQVCPDCHGS
jgi:hypothetical protein